MGSTFKIEGGWAGGIKAGAYLQLLRDRNDGFLDMIYPQFMMKGSVDLISVNTELLDLDGHHRVCL